MADAVVLPVRLANGALVHIEARPLDGPAPPGAGQSLDRDDDVGTATSLTGVTPSLEGALAGVEALANDISAMLERVAPDQATVEFDVELAAEAGRLTSLIVKGSGKATFKVTLSWKKAPKPPG